MKEMTLIYLQKDNKTLLIQKSNKDPVSGGKYLGVGGKVDPTDKSIEEGAKREVLEETGLTANTLIKKGEVTFIGQRAVPSHVTIYTCTDFSGNLVQDHREGTLHWIDDSNIMNLPMWEGDKTFIPKLFQEGTFKLELTYKDKKLIKVEEVN